MTSNEPSRKTSFAKGTRKTLPRVVLVALLILMVDSVPVYAQSEADAVGSAVAPAASATSMRRPAPKVADPSIGLELEYQVDNADVCVIWPEQPQDAGCKGLKSQNLDASVKANTPVHGPSPRSMALLRYDNGTATISVAHAPTTRKYIAQEEIDDLLDEFLVGFKQTGHTNLTMSGSTPGSRYDVMEVNGVDALRFEMTADAPRGTFAYAWSRAVGYVLFGKHGKVTIVALTDPQHMRHARVALESIVKTVRMPPLAQRGFDKASPIVRLLQSEFGLFLLVLLVVGLFTVIERQRRKVRSQRR